MQEPPEYDGSFLLYRMALNIGIYSVNLLI